MTLTIVVVKPAGRSRPPLCPWVIDVPDGAPPQKPAK